MRFAPPVASLCSWMPTLTRRVREFFHAGPILWAVGVGLMLIGTACLPVDGGDRLLSPTTRRSP